jgi:hypothetical protein
MHSCCNSYWQAPCASIGDSPTTTNLESYGSPCDRFSPLLLCSTLVWHIAGALSWRQVLTNRPNLLVTMRICKSSGGCADWASHLLIRKFWIPLNAEDSLAMQIEGDITAPGRGYTIQCSRTVLLHNMNFKQSTNQLFRVLKRVRIEQARAIVSCPFRLPLSIYLNCQDNNRKTSNKGLSNGVESGSIT